MGLKGYVAGRINENHSIHMSLSSCGPVSLFFVFFFFFFVVSPFSHDHFLGVQERPATTKTVPVIWKVLESVSSVTLLLLHKTHILIDSRAVVPHAENTDLNLNKTS